MVYLRCFIENIQFNNIHIILRNHNISCPAPPQYLTLLCQTSNTSLLHDMLRLRTGHTELTLLFPQCVDIVVTPLKQLTSHARNVTH